MANEFKQFMGLLIFGNIENLILSAQGATAHVDPFILGGLSLICVVCWLLLNSLLNMLDTLTLLVALLYSF